MSQKSRQHRSGFEARQGQDPSAQELQVFGRLAAGVAHDLNNLFMIIVGQGESLLDPGCGQERCRESVEEILSVTKRAQALTRHLVAFSRKQGLEPKVVDPNELIGNLDKIVRSLTRADIGVVYALEPRIGRIEVDVLQFEQLVLSLVANACEAMPNGGKLVIETADVELDDAYTSRHIGVETGAYVRLTVSDTGTGMDQKTLGQVFEPYFTTKDCDRTGLGLSTAYGIVKQSGGNIWVYSEPGLGTTFKIYLPRVSEPVETAAPDRRPAETAGGLETILLVDDEDAVRVLIRDALRRRGFTVLDAKHAKDALRISREHEGPIDLLLTDVVMPQISGRELARRILALHRGAKTLYMSGYPAEAIRTHGVLDQDVEFLEKPISPRKVAVKVCELLGRDR